MKALLLLLPLLLTGCASVYVSKTMTDGSKVEFRTRSLFSNSALKGLKVDGVTKTTTNLLSITSTSTEPNPESITATGTALGELIGAAAATAAKTAIK